MSGVPLITEIYILIIHCMGLILLILPHATTSPSGIANSSVSIKISRVGINPPISSVSTVVSNILDTPF